MVAAEDLSCSLSSLQETTARSEMDSSATSLLRNLTEKVSNEVETT